MDNEPENQNPIDVIGEKIMECLPKSLQTEEFAYRLGSLCGLFCGYFFGKAVAGLLFPRDREDKK